MQATGSLWIDAERVAEGAIEQLLFAAREGLDIGRDLPTPVSKNYESPFPFTGELESVAYTLC